LDWIGLDWIGWIDDWIGLDWIGLDWIGLDWIGLDWIGWIDDWIGLLLARTVPLLVLSRPLAANMVKVLLVIECQNFLNWYQVFQGARLRLTDDPDDEGEEIQVEQVRRSLALVRRQAVENDIETLPHTYRRHGPISRYARTHRTAEAPSCRSARLPVRCRARRNASMNRALCSSLADRDG